MDHRCHQHTLRVSEHNRRNNDWLGWPIFRTVDGLRRSHPCAQYRLTVHPPASSPSKPGLPESLPLQPKAATEVTYTRMSRLGHFRDMTRAHARRVHSVSLVWLGSSFPSPIFFPLSRYPVPSTLPWLPTRKHLRGKYVAVSVTIWMTTSCPNVSSVTSDAGLP